jgi:hypothetical protein
MEVVAKTAMSPKSPEDAKKVKFAWPFKGLVSKFLLPTQPGENIIVMFMGAPNLVRRLDRAQR